MESLDELLRQAEAPHVHLCAELALGVRTALLGLERRGIAVPCNFSANSRCASTSIPQICRLTQAIASFARTTVRE